MFNQHFSIFSIVLLLFVTVGLTLLFSILKNYLPLLLSKTNQRTSRIKPWLYLAEISLIITVLSIFISYSFSRNIILATVLFLLLLMIFYFISLFFLKDYIAGLLIKTSGIYKIGDQLRIDNASGKIIHLGKTQLEIKNTNGDTIYLPYSSLNTKIKSFQQQKEKINGYSFTCRMTKSDNSENKREKLQQFIQELPWIHPLHSTEIKLNEEQNNEYLFQITIFAFDKKYYRKIEKAILDKFEKR